MQEALAKFLESFGKVGRKIDDRVVLLFLHLLADCGPAR